mmetsp:Transcript_27249/g.45593  ORF Transcript_27249/g.45593 Transcript_27249/m.45593 type:complete len:412 (-) Transcript_27249:404-1639(-)|eukprot:CAMPEP_0198211024 /NCGR_PEP_ID=MMETSP1445-20131203/22579_1 /TAXON_ID=36898 /ORGANISM="Pyramimonas sp., Strain CCMP2087" /LENGTH=411 /DNA_ID=CAMNT_0043885207 /DNA_START=191 /DNA_END=1426 /DNA_ORIENTATION=-
MNNVSFDLEGYISNYTGHAKFQRLRFIAEKVGLPLELEALRMAADEVKKGENTALYSEIIEKIGGRLGDAYQIDKEWIAKVDRESAKRLEKLELELNQYKANLIKESIRMGHNDLGDFYYERGDLQSAFKSYVRTRDYCTTSKHIITMCLNVINVSFELGNYVHVTNYVQKAEQTPDVQDPVVLAKLRCAAGLAGLENKKYKVAARKFVEVHAELLSKNNYSEVISPQDVALYGALCALASFDRSELKEKVIDNNVFRNFLELVPEVRELINDFYASRYASCLSYLDNLRPSLALDVHLHDHVDRLYKQIRHKALIQYTTPFISVNLSTMAQAFNTTVTGIEKELAALIMDNQIQARIDSHNKILYARHADQRNTTFQKTLATGEAYVRDTHAMLLRASLLQHDIVQKHSK